MFVLQSEEILRCSCGVANISDRSCNGNFDLTLDITEHGDELACMFNRMPICSSQKHYRLMGHFQNILEGMTRNAEQKISELTLLTKAERRQLLYDWNATAVSTESASSIQEMFERQTAATPEKVAVVCDDEKLTYRELNERANQLAHYLRERGVRPDTMVGLCLHRSANLIVALLGILKAGGAYVPLDQVIPSRLNS